MRLARIVGTVTGTARDRSLGGKKLLVVDLIDAAGNVTDGHHVAVDAIGAGRGDLVIVVSGSAARQAADTGTVATDLAVVAIVDELNVPNTAE